MKYIDEEGDNCTLVEATFTDFMETAQETSCGRYMLKVQVERLPLTLAPEEMQPMADSANMEAEEGQWIFEEEIREEEERKRKRRDEEDARQNEEAKRRRDEEERENKRKEDEEEERKAVETRAKLEREQEHEKELCRQRLEWDNSREGEWSGCEEEENAPTEADDVDSGLEEDWEFVECDRLEPANSSDCAVAAERPAEDEEDDTMKEIKAELNRIKAACEAELERHLDEWLLTAHGQPRYEDWIAAVHPENVKEKLISGHVIDARMYLEGSFHRQLWNLRVAGLACLDEAGRQRCHVPPRDPRSPAILCGSSKPLSAWGS